MEPHSKDQRSFSIKSFYCSLTSMKCLPINNTGSQGIRLACCQHSVRMLLFKLYLVYSGIYNVKHNNVRIRLSLVNGEGRIMLKNRFGIDLKKKIFGRHFVSFYGAFACAYCADVQRSFAVWGLLTGPDGHFSINARTRHMSASPGESQSYPGLAVSEHLWALRV